jgi:hypothetical protein
MAVNNSSKHEFYLNNTLIEKINKFKFLGVLIQSNQGHKEHLARRKQMYYSAVK